MLENEGVALREVRWSEFLPWLSIVKSLRMAITLRLMTFGAVGVLFTLVGWWGIACVFSHDGMPNRSWNGLFAGQSAWQVINHSVPNFPLGPSGGMYAGGLKTEDFGGPMIYTWGLLSPPVVRIFSIESPRGVTPLTGRDFLSLLLSALWSLAVWAYFGAAISRVAAVQLATGEKVGWGASLRWAAAKWLAYFSAPLMPMLGVALVVLPILVLGLLMKSDLLAMLAALLWPLVLVGGFVMTLLLVGVLLGWPLMFATISAEGTDSFDALNRTYAYVFQRPLGYLFYTIVAALLGWLGWFVVKNFAALVVWLAFWAASCGTGWARMQELTAGTSDSSLVYAATGLIAFWTWCVKLLAVGYSFSYFFVAATAIYYLLRRDVDARETDEVFLDADRSEERFGLPKLEKDAAGAPEISDATARDVGSGDAKPNQTPGPEKPIS